MISILLRDLVVVISLIVVVRLITHRLSMPPLVGLIVAGIIAGPSATALIPPGEAMEVLAELGVILLLFTVGMQLSLARLKGARLFFLGGGSLQVALTALGGTIVGMSLGRPCSESILLGFLLSLSSTAIVFALLSEQQKVNSNYGKRVVAVLLFQDLAIIPMILLIPLLSGYGTVHPPTLGWFTLKIIFIIGGVLMVAIKVVPYILHRAYSTGSRDVCLMTVLAICFAIAWLADFVGLNLSIGAFLAGAIISNSDYRKQTTKDILPLQGLFSSVFFVSVGTLMDLQFLFDHLFLAIAASVGVVVLKATVMASVGFLLRQPYHVIVIIGLALAQVGEFSFVLIREGMNHGLVTNFHYQLFLTVALVTMSVTPWLLSGAERLTGGEAEDVAS